MPRGKVVASRRHAQAPTSLDKRVYPGVTALPDNQREARGAPD